MLTIFLASRFIFLLGLLLSGNQATPDINISYPEDGNVVEGIVEIRGNIPVEGFTSAKLSYAYAGENEDNWFLIANIERPIQDEVLGVWDTTTITDGQYQIRLRVKDISGEKRDVIVTGIQVANYSRSEPGVDDKGTTASVYPSAIVTEDLSIPSPTILPANPATITAAELRGTAFTGLMMGLGLVILVVLWSYIHHR